ncbi:MAG: hypothetical protein Q8S18_08065 [Bacteroidales bacterium]|nr:hypothetical protein [Bacteroidales bacterium]
MKKYLVLTGILFIVGLNLLKAQCCAAGNPLNMMLDAQSIGKQSLRMSLLYRYSLSDTYYQGSKPIDINYLDKSGFNYLEFAALYNITERIGIQAEIGYFLSKYESYKNPLIKDSEGSGLADLNLMLRYELIQKPFEKLNLSLTGGVKLPVGVFDQEVDQVKLPINVQPSSGSYRYHGGFTVAKGFRYAPWQILGATMVEYSQRISSRFFDYQYGTVYAFQAGTSYTFHQKALAIIQVRAEVREKSKRENNQIVDASGGEIVLLVPQINIIPAKNWGASLSFSLPVYRRYHDIQFGNKYSFSLVISRTQKLIK